RRRHTRSYGDWSSDVCSSDLGAEAVSRFVHRRLARLSPAAQEIARTVAVLGDRGDLQQAAELAGLERAVVADAAGALTRADVLASGSPLSFVHPLVRDAVYEAMPPSEREQKHARAATLLIGASEDAAFSSPQLLTSSAL